MILNRQSQEAVDLADARQFSRRVHSLLRLGRREFNVCFVSDAEIAALNKRYRKKPHPTDVLSFPWRENGAASRAENREFKTLFGDVIISPRTAHRNARREKHSLREEIRWLILHGVLHLMGYDHETDSGEMLALELQLRERLAARARVKRRQRRKA